MPEIDTDIHMVSTDIKGLKTSKKVGEFSFRKVIFKYHIKRNSVCYGMHESTKHMISNRHSTIFSFLISNMQMLCHIV